MLRIPAGIQTQTIGKARYGITVLVVNVSYLHFITKFETVISLFKIHALIKNKLLVNWIYFFSIKHAL